MRSINRNQTMHITTQVTLSFLLCTTPYYTLILIKQRNQMVVWLLCGPSAIIEPPQSGLNWVVTISARIPLELCTLLKCKIHCNRCIHLDLTMHRIVGVSGSLQMMENQEMQRESINLSMSSVSSSPLFKRYFSANNFCRHLILHLSGTGALRSSSAVLTLLRELLGSS